MKVNFYDASTADRTNGATLTKWKWDFDVSKEYNCSSAPENCDGNTSNDIDSTQQNPIFTYPTAGTVRVKLTVEDSDGNTAENLSNPFSPGQTGTAGGVGAPTPDSDVLKADLSAVAAGVTMRSTPIAGCTPATANECRTKIIEIPTQATSPQDEQAEAKVSFLFNGSRGDIQSYSIDKNIYCDSNGDGNTENDVDNADNVSGGCEIAGTGVPTESCFTTTYKSHAKTSSPKGNGNATARLTVKDADGRIKTDQVNVAFRGTITDDEILTRYDCDGNPYALLGGSFLTRLGSTYTILLSLLAGVIVILTAFGTSNLLTKGHRRK
jgi:PKD repeat protein